MKCMLPIFVLLALSLCVSIVHADGGQWYLLSPKMILRLNTTDLPYVASIGVRNTDSDVVDIQIRPPETLTDVIFFDESELNFTLSSNETRWINFSVNPEEPNNYTGDVMVLFTSRDPNVTNAALASEIMILMQAEVVPPVAETNQSTYVIVIIAVIIVIAVASLLRRR